MDPLKDFSLNLLTNIRNLINLKGCDLLQAFKESDPKDTGYVYFRDFKDCFTRFGL